MQPSPSSCSDSALSRCILFDYLDLEGPAPTARWGHTAVLIDDQMYLFGGVASQLCSDLLVLDLGRFKTVC